MHRVVEDEESLRKTGNGPASATWVGVVKATPSDPCVRSRWAAREFNPKGERDREGLAAGMPPLEAKNALLMLAKVGDQRI